jgi:hypothetical protein
MMKKAAMVSMIAIGFMLTTTGTCHAQVNIIGEALKRVIMAIDLRIQKMQTRTILLQAAQRQLENVMEATHLADITDWVQQQKDQYSVYYQELWQVKDVLQYYSAVKTMIDKEARLIAGCKQAYSALAVDSHVSAEEVEVCAQVYQGILRQSSRTIDQLSTVIRAFTTQMDDADRLRIINELSAGIDRDYRQLSLFTQQTILLSLQRAKDAQDMNLIKALYGLP